MLSRRGRIELDRAVEAWIVQALQASPTVESLPVTAVIATAVGMLEDSFPGDPADRVIYSTAASLDCLLVTRDDRIRGYAPDRTVWD